MYFHGQTATRQDRKGKENEEKEKRGKREGEQRGERKGGRAEIPEIRHTEIRLYSSDKTLGGRKYIVGHTASREDAGVERRKGKDKEEKGNSR